MSLSSNINEKANLIWAIADKLTGVYKPHEYGKVILPLTVIRRFDCILSDTKQAVLDKHNSMAADMPMRDNFLKKASGYEFYNTSKYTFESLLDDSNNIEANFRNYINGFSANVRQIIENFKFDNEIQTMADKNLLYIVLQEFTTPKADLHPNKISNLEMGYIFEEIIRRFSEAHNEDAGQHYTPREVIELMVNILFANDVDILTGNVAKTLYDPACGTGGMLSVAQDYMKKLNSSAILLPFGQEINDETFAVCKADMLIKDNNADNIRNGNTLSDDNFKGEKFDYILSNPPFGREWKNDKKAVEDEAKLGAGGRFQAGLPAVSDSQMLFLQTAISKMKEPENGGAKIAIIHNGSPLFTGDAGSGPSEIRKYVLEKDLLEAIIALPNDIFYNTGIATYIWVLNNKKPNIRKGKVQLINANELYEKRRKSLGNKRNDIPKHYIDEITKIYAEFKETEISKIFDNEDFGYSKIVVERPQKDENGALVLKGGKPVADVALRDTENVPLKEDIGEYFKREVLPYATDAWIDDKKTKLGYEIPFTRYFYKYVPPRKSEDIMAEIMELEKSLDGSLEGIFND
jgi:type I restriction enzyme M protein